VVKPKKPVHDSKPKKGTKKYSAPAARARDSDSDEAELFPGEECSPPEGVKRIDPRDAREYRRMFQHKAYMHDTTRLFAGLLLLAKKLWPATYAMMTAPKFGPLMESVRRDMPSEADLQQYVFHELLRLQASLGLSPKGENSISILYIQKSVQSISKCTIGY